MTKEQLLAQATSEVVEHEFKYKRPSIEGITLYESFKERTGKAAPTKQCVWDHYCRGGLKYDDLGAETKARAQEILKVIDMLDRFETPEMLRAEVKAIKNHYERAFVASDIFADLLG